ncbi:hypothetical protein CAPTEDRAFT_168280 [Capitella teleta]|uniref:peptidylprolyl isomerase n=1 Tax=Capitella teleta TaxID=283909 RepID=R7UIN4_CAPTE|nr:hypothetical protein CAPTEDRAFT_168280 [Capitella teleta]|eukprot:ELU06040.1 hypothetical protein CAPTEDRAFT_168280 [Capitella teleta]
MMNKEDAPTPDEAEERLAAAMKEAEVEGHAEQCDLLKEEKEVDSSEEDGWTYVLGHDKLKKKVLTKGDGERPVNGQMVTIKCAGHLPDGKAVDQHDNLRFTLGDGDVIQAFDLCVALADEHETFELFTAAQYAYGAFGKPDSGIPPNSDIIYEIAVLKVEPAIDYASLSVSDRVELADSKRERGNELYLRCDHSAAINSYTKALKIVDSSTESRREDATELQKLIDMRVKCYNNMTAAQLKVEAFDAAIKSADEVLRIQPENVKALFRKGKCLAAKGEVTSAISCLKKALKLEPDSKIIHSELSRLTTKFRAEEQSQKAMYQRMLGTDKKPFIPEKQGSSSNTWLYAGIAGAVAVVSAAVAYKAAL